MTIPFVTSSRLRRTYEKIFVDAPKTADLTCYFLLAGVAEDARKPCEIVCCLDFCLNKINSIIGCVDLGAQT